MRLRSLISSAVLGTLLSASALVPLRAEARKQTEYRYPLARVWNSALRMVRVDMRLPITDRDQEAGYMLFEYIDGARRHPGSIELVESERDSRPIVRAVISVEGMPSYVEQMMLDKLAKKLENEYGAPMEPVREKPPEKKPDDSKKPPKEPAEAPPAPNGDEAPAEF
jgi:hypothetical protein